MARWAIGLVGLAIGGGCATADTSDQTASSPFSSGFSSVGDGGGADATADGGGGDTDTEGEDATSEGPAGNDPTVGPVETGDDGGAAGECCSAHGEPGCADPMIAACVCGEDPTCCDDAWDAACVDAVAAFGCGDCGGGAPPDGDEGGGMPPLGDCCEAQGGPGCADVAVANCVCDEDPFCCENVWNEGCVAEVDELGCGNCGGAMPPADDGGGGGSPCCAPTGVPGCGDPFVEACICGKFADAFCCLVEWDAVCAAEVADFGCGPC
jgi:hypothetical protein